MDEAMVFTRVWFAGMFGEKKERDVKEVVVREKDALETMSLGELLFHALAGDARESMG